MLGECKALTHLELCGNDLCDRGARRLAKALGQCSTLQYLNVAGCSFGLVSAGTLVGALEECAALTHLNLSGNHFGGEEGAGTELGGGWAAVGAGRVRGAGGAGPVRQPAAGLRGLG
eukprot:896588-Rhodomonas_salina.1